MSCRIALIGDSQAEALWPRIQKAAPTAQFVLVRAQRGWAEIHYNKEGRLAQELKAAAPDIVVVELGGNNSLTTEARYRPESDRLLASVREAKPKRILFLGPAAATKEPYKSNKEWTRSFQSAYLASQPDITWIDSFPYTQSGHTDGVHFNSSTYDTWAAAIARHLQQFITQCEKADTTLSRHPSHPALSLVGGLCVLLLAGTAAVLRYTRSRSLQR